ncbi:MAG TPA: serine/threonine-protein kinase, partial [Polyangiaceae bacterium]|nr:serine/threonine-protein kinase [Polyangiaceae bacterium]
MNPHDLPSVGATLVSKYRLTRELGRGGMGAVFEAEHLRLGQKVAIKVVLPEVAKQPELAYRFEHEGRAAAKLRGRHTVRVLDVDTTPEGLPFMVMELLEGHSLRDELKRRGPLPIEDAVRYVREACEGIDEAHQAGIIHRDLKPANLFLSLEGGRSVVKVVDFGIAKAHDDSDQDYRTATNVPLGTYKYMSPEQARSARSVDARTDVWSLGVVLYQLLTGQTPFDGDGAFGVMLAIATQAPPPLRSWRPDVPEELAALIERALCKDVAGRPQTARAFAQELAPFEGARGSLLPHASMGGSSGGSWVPGAPFSAAAGTPAMGLTPPPPGSAGPGPAWAPSPSDMPASQQVSNESITSASKNHVVPIKAGVGRGPASPWLVRLALVLLVGVGALTGLVAVRPPSPEVAPLTPNALSERAPASLAPAAPTAPTAPMAADTAEAAKVPAPSSPAASAAPTPVLAPVDDPPSAASHAGAEGGAKATSGAASARAGAKPPAGKATPGKAAGEAAPRPAASAAKPAEKKERTDIDRFD